MGQSIQFTKIMLEGKDNQLFEARIPKNDRFNDEFFKHMKNGGVDGLTNCVIDEIVIKPISNEVEFKVDRAGKPQVGPFKCSMEGLLREHDSASNVDVISAFVAVIKSDIMINSCGTKSFNQDDKSWKIEMCKMAIPYKTQIEYGILSDEE